MAWIARDKDTMLHAFTICPLRGTTMWIDGMSYVALPSNADEKLIGRHITWEDEPVEI